MTSIVLGGPDSRLPSLAFCSRYNRDAHYGDVKDSAGIARWVTQKQMRVYGIIARLALGDGRATMLAIAHEAQCHPTTVSRALLKIQAWGLYAVDVRRGRNGGITIWKVTGDRFALYVKAARQKLRELAIRARINVASRIQRGRGMAIVSDQETVGLPSNDVIDMDATFSAEYLYHEGKRALKEQLRAADEAFNVYLAQTQLGSFGLRVIEERRRLAIEDPGGEEEAVSPVWKAALG